MAGANRFATTGISLERDLAEVAARLCRVTVRVRGAGYGAGSGVVWTRGGLIVTNAHVATARRLAVELSDGRLFEGELLGRDPAHDLAVLQVEADGVEFAEARDPCSLRTGEIVLAVGNPTGSAGAFAVGMLSARPAADDVLVRADIRLAPGNSGGPLADAAGRVIGINSMVADGFGIAISSRVVQRFVREVVRAEVKSMAEAG